MTVAKNIDLDVATNYAKFQTCLISGTAQDELNKAYEYVRTSVTDIADGISCPLLTPEKAKGQK